MEHGASAVGRGPGDGDPWSVGVPVDPPGSGAQSPMFSARVDDVRGVVRVRGHVDRLGAEDLIATVQRLAEEGHARITVEIGGLATAEPAAVDLLAGLAPHLAARDVSLALVS